MKKKSYDNSVELKMIEDLVHENAKLRETGCELAERAMYTVGHYDGLHRLSLAVANWAKIVANENGRSKNKRNNKHSS